MEAPTTVRRLGEEHPRPVGKARVTRGLGNERADVLRSRAVHLDRAVELLQG